MWLTREDEIRSQRLFWSRVVRASSGALIGAIPGALIATFAPHRIGIAVVLLGMPIGVVIAFQIAAPKRLLKLLFGILVAKNIPFLKKGAWNWVDEQDEPDERSVAASDRLLQWLAPVGVHERRDYWVLTALILGLIFGGILMARDSEAVQAGKPGVFLPMPGAKDPIFTQALLMTVAFGIWGAGGMGIMVSAVYRRPIVLAASIASYCTACIFLAADNGRGPSGVDVVVFFATAATGFALLLTALSASEFRTESNADAHADGEQSADKTDV